MYNTLDIYRKILNLKNINEIISMFDNKEYLDFEYDKYLYNPSIKKHYLSEKAVNKNVSRELELAFIKDRYNIFYDLYYNLFQNTQYYIEQTYTLTDGDTVEINGLIEEDEDGYYKVVVEGGPIITLNDKDDNDVQLTNFNGSAQLRVGDYYYVLTDVAYSSPSTTITLENDNLNSVRYNYLSETDEDLETRIEQTEDYRKLFLRYIPHFEIFKGTKKYIEFVMKYYYLLKYWDIDENSTINISSAESATTVTEGDKKINFVYYVTSLIPKTEWDLYVKPCVHPHGWIDIYYESTHTDNILQEEFNHWENKPTYIDVLLSTKDNILRQVSTVKKYGNIETKNDYINLGVDAGTLTIAGGFDYYEFSNYDSNNEKVSESVSTYTVVPPQFSFKEYTYTDGEISGTKIDCIFETTSKPDTDNYIECLGSYYISDMLNIENITDADVTGDSSVMEGTFYSVNDVTPTGNYLVLYDDSTNTVSNDYPSVNTHLYIATVIWDISPIANPATAEILYVSDIISFEIVDALGGSKPNPGGPYIPITGPTEPASF